MPLLQKAYLGSTALFAEKPWFYGIEPKLVDVAYSVSVTASASTHTKGSWIELISSTSGAGSLLVISVAGLQLGNTSTAALIDIGKGASGSETAIASNVAVGMAAANATANENPVYCLAFCLPTNIAASTRIAARIQATIASDVAVVTSYLFDIGDRALMPSTVDVLGANTATSAGTSISANNTWTEIVSSTSQDYVGFCVVPSISASATNVNNNATFEIGVGASGSEVAFGNTFAVVRTDERVATHNGVLPIIGREVPSGSRIAVRQNTANSFFDATVIAIP